MELQAHGISRFLQTYSPGQAIFQAGDKGSHMYVVHEGSVDIVSETDGRRVCLASLQQGKFFGEMALVDKAPRTASAIAGDGGAKVLAVDRPHFVYLVSQQPAFALIVMEALVSRLRATAEEPVLAAEAA